MNDDNIISTNSKLEETLNLIEWIQLTSIPDSNTRSTMLLSDIAKSLAIIADVVQGGIKHD